MTLVFNGTSKNHIKEAEVTDLTPGLTYNFQLYALNKIFRSETPASLDLIIGTVTSKPLAVRRTSSDYVVDTIEIEWNAPADLGGVQLLNYDVFVDDGSGTFSNTPFAQTLATVRTLAIDSLTF